MPLKQQHPPRRGPPSLLSGLIYQLQTINPVEFQLPEDIRTYFKDGQLILPFIDLEPDNLGKLVRGREEHMLTVQKSNHLA